jgi:beta-lactamase class D
MNKALIFSILFFSLLFSCNKKEKIHAELQVPKTIYSQQDTFQNIIDRSLLKGSILVYSVNEDTYFSNDFEAAKIGDLPASTFKIPNSIIGLETGVIEDEESVFEWDGKKKLFKSWEKTMNLKEAYKVSCLPCYQDMAAKIGVEKMETSLQKLNYGQMDVDSNNVHQFWVRGKSKINPLEQIDFLQRLYYAKLPIKESTYNVMKNIMLLEDNEEYKLYGKTGWSNQDDDNIGWFVGYLEKNDHTYFFATKVRPQASFNMDNFIRIRKEVTMQAFRSLDILY